MQLDYGGTLEGKKAFRLIGTEKVFHKVELTNVSGSLRSPTSGNGVVEISGLLIDHEDGTATIVGEAEDGDD